MAELTQAERDMLGEVRALLFHSGRGLLYGDKLADQLIALADRVCPKVEWHDVSVDGVVTGGIAVCNGWTLTVSKSYLRPTGHKFAWHAVGPDFETEASDDEDTIDAAKSAAVEWAKGS